MATPTVVKRKALGLINRAWKVAVAVKINGTKVAVVEISKCKAREVVRRLPPRSQVAVEDVFGTIVLGV